MWSHPSSLAMVALHGPIHAHLHISCVPGLNLNVDGDAHPGKFSTPDVP
jgi:hypothetical protein